MMYLLISEIIEKILKVIFKHDDTHETNVKLNKKSDGKL